MTLVVLAAGLGSRYGGLKQIEPFGPNGEFIIDYSVYDSITAGCDKVIFIIKEENLDDFRETIGRRIESSIKVDYAFQRMENIPANPFTALRQKPWGTTHALLSCKDKLLDDFIVINADDFYGRDSYLLVAEYLKSLPKDAVNEYCMPGYNVFETLSDHGEVARGVCKVDEKSFLKEITEQKRVLKSDGRAVYKDQEGTILPIEDSAVASMNFWGFRKSIFGFLQQSLEHFIRNPKIDLQKDELYLTNTIEHITNNNLGRVKVLNTPSEWFGVTYERDRNGVLENINKNILSGLYPKDLWS